MRILQTLKSLYFATVAALLTMATGVVAAEYRLHISLETPPTHIRNVSIVQFAEQLKQRSGGRLDVKVFHAASQYKGSNVPVALAQGALDMGVPGVWHLGKLVPEAGAPILPMFYGVSPDRFHKIWDGKAGDVLVDKIEKKIRVKVIGKALDLGYGTIFTTKDKIAKPQQIAGMKMRTPGGAATVYRYKGLGANPVSIPFPDLPQALQRGTVDGFMSNQEAVRSAKLWDAGVKYALETREAFYQYLPMIGLPTWNKYPKDIQDMIIATWAESIDNMRKTVLETQIKAREINGQNGIVTTFAAQADLDAARDTLMAQQPKIVEELGIDPAFMTMLKAEANTP